MLQQTPFTQVPAEQSAVDRQSLPNPSVTCTANDTLDELLRESLAVHVTVWSPTANRFPDGGTQMTEAAPLI